MAASRARWQSLLAEPLKMGAPVASSWYDENDPTLLASADSAGTHPCDLVAVPRQLRCFTSCWEDTWNRSAIFFSGVAAFVAWLIVTWGVFLFIGLFSLPPQTLAAPDEKPGRLRLCVNADVPAYGNMQDRADKSLQWLHAHKKEYVGAIAALGEEGEKFKRAVDSADLDNPQLLEGFRWTFSVGHAAGCLEYEKQLATQAASATSDGIFDSCINANLAAQMRAAMTELPDFELKQRQNFGDPNFSLGKLLGIQRGHVDGCVLADALKRSAEVGKP
jgi:hypothetical protein